MGHTPEDGEPFEGDPIVPQQGTRLDIDGQTNAESSKFKTGLQSEISSGDAKLGQAITKQGEELGGEIAGNSAKIEKVVGSIEGISAGIASSIEDIEKDLKFLTGDKDSEFTAEEVSADIEKYLAEQADAIKIIKSGDDATPGQAQYARLWLSNFGETYSAIHFLGWKLKDFSNVVDDLDSTQMEQYTIYVEKLRKQLVNLISKLAETDVDKPEYAELQDQISDVSEQFSRITDVDELNPEDITKNIATLEKGIQYFFDIDTSAFDEFKEILATRALGIGVDGDTEGTGEYFRILHAEFSDKATEMGAYLEMAEKADEDNVELTGEESFNVEKAMWFRSQFTLVATLASVFSYDDWRDRLNQVNFREDVYQQYVDFIDSSKEVLSKLQKSVENPDASEEEKTKYNDKISGIGEELRSYTCETELDPYAKCQAGHFAWYLNEHNTDEESFRTTLATRALGIGIDGNTEGTGEYYRILHAEFSDKAEEMRAHLDMAEKADEDNVELTGEDAFNVEKAMWFRSQFTLVSTMAAVLSYDDWRDRLNQVNFREDVYNEYVDFIDTLKEMSSKLQKALVNAKPGSDEETKYTEEISKINEEISLYTCVTELDPYAKCQAGHFAWYLNKHNTDENSFRTTLAERALGIGVDGNTEGTGEYYRVLHAEFSDKAEEMRAYLDMAEKADEDNVELEGEDAFNVEKAMWFRSQFTLVATMAAVLSYDDWRDRLNQVNFSEGVYSEYVDFIDMLKQELSKFQGALSGLDPDDPAREKYNQIISNAGEQLSSYTCATDLEPYAKCQAGHFAWYLNEHDTDEESYRVATNEEIGLNPLESVADLDVNKTVFRLVTEEAIAILKAPIDSNPISVVEAAQAHIDRFGRDSNSTVAYSEWQNYVLETNVSDAVGEILNASDCISDRLVSDINEAIDNVSIEEALVYPFADGERNSFDIVVEGEYRIILVTLNGLIQNGFVGQTGKLEFGFAPALGSQISVLVEKTTDVNLSKPVVDNCEFSIDDILKKGTYKCSETRRAIANLRRLLDSTQNNIDESKQSKADKETFVADLTAAIESYTKAIDKADAAITKANEDLKKTMGELKGAQANLNVKEVELNTNNVKLEDIQTGIRDNEISMAEADNTIKLNQTLKAAELARPFPDQNVLEIYDTNIANAKDEKSAIEEALVTLRDDEKALISTIETIESDIETLQEEVSNLTTSADESKSIISANNTTKSVSENNKNLSNDVKVDTEAGIAKLSKYIEESKNEETSIQMKLKDADEAAEQFCSSAESVKNITSRSATVAEAIDKTEGKTYAGIIGEVEVKTTGYFNIGVVGDGPGRAAIATNPPEFELMDENFDLKALNEDGTEMEP